MEKMDFFRKFMDVFESKGFRILHADDFEQAYQVLGSQSVDIVAMDMDAGYEDAFKFCYKVKKNKNLSKIFVIGLTSAHERFDIYLTANTAEEKRWLNLDMLVHKPIGIKNFYRLLKRELAILEGLDTTQLDSVVDYIGYNQ